MTLTLTDVAGPGMLFSGDMAKLFWWVLLESVGKLGGGGGGGRGRGGVGTPRPHADIC